MDASLEKPVDIPTSLIEGLNARALDDPRQLAYCFLDDDGTEASRLSYGELRATVRTLGATLRRAGLTGERALLVYPPGLDFVTAFLGCLAAGVIAVPAYPPGSRRTLPRLGAIVRDARPQAVLTCSSHLQRYRNLASSLPELRSLLWIATDTEETAPERAEDPTPDAPASDAVAFLQYTSGSTSTPKGVEVTHGNLAANEEMIRRAFVHTEDSVVVGWLPFYHDMGLIGNVLQPLYCGARCVLLSPWAFLRRPVLWLRAISRYRATTSGGPNFAYDLCVQKVSPEEREELDLSSWRVAFNGAEPVRAETLRRFTEAFAPCGFRPESFYPCYGLAEATLFVTGGEVEQTPQVLTVAAEALALGLVGQAPPADPTLPGTGPPAGGACPTPERTADLVSSGAPSPDLRLVVVDPETSTPCPPGQVGEIRIAGPNVAHGYRNRPEESAETFDTCLADGTGPFLRTGDLGFLCAGELYVTGRLKDLVILRGRNLYPQDVEWSSEASHAALRAQGAAAFSVDVGGEERLVVVQEIERRREAEAGEAAEAVRRAVAEEHEARVYDVVIARAGAVPKTSSGKVRRRPCRDAYLAGELKVVARSTVEYRAETPLDDTLQDETLGLTREALAATAEPQRRALLEAYLAREVASVARLGDARVAVDKPLTALGLDSLAAVELEYRLTSDLEVEVSMADLLAGTSLARLTEDVLGQLEEPAAASRSATAGFPTAVKPDDTAREFPLSAGQESLWFLARLAPESTAYHLVGAARVQKGLDPTALGRAFGALVQRHPALRTTFHAVGDAPPYQEVHEDGGSVLVEDAMAWDEARIRERLHEEAYRPFDLEAGPLARLLVLALPSGEHRLLLAMHHLVADLWSLTVLMRDLGRFYAAETDGATPPEPLSVRYADQVRWERTWLAGPDGGRLERYWYEQLESVPHELDLPTDRPRPRRASFRGARVSRKLSAALTDDLRQHAGQSGSTLFMVLLAAYQTLLHRSSGQTRFLVGSPTTGRHHAAVEELVGYFVNPLALAADFSGRPSGGELHERVRQTVIEAFEHQDYPFPRLAERFDTTQRETGRSPLFQTAFALQKARWSDTGALAAFALGFEDAELTLGGVTLESLALEERGAPFELSLFGSEWQGGLALGLNFNSDLWDATTARRMLGHFEVLLRGLAADPGAEVAALPLLGEAESWQVAAEWNDTAAAYPDSSSLVELFKAQAARTPDALAVVSEDGTALTYRELERRSGRLAHRLAGRGVEPGQPVGIVLERSAAFVVATLAVLEAGGVYVPLDPSYPAERRSFMIDDAGVRAVLDSRVLDDVDNAATDRTPLPCRNEPDSRAYVIYTSGSTGRPKGIAVSHRAVSRLVLGTDYVHLTAGDRVAHASNTAFDAATFEIWGALLHGATLVVISPSTALLPVAFGRRLADERVSTLFVTTALFNEIARQSPAAFGGLRTLLFGGEAVDPRWVRRVRETAPPERLLHVYGPTEGTTYSSWHPVGEVAADASTIPIGRPLANATAYVVDRHGGLLPTGTPGELRIGGGGLARGYAARPALTAAAFVPDPWSTEAGRRLYATGDLVRRRADGAVEFLGRIDHQVKLRGFRIELGEIEVALAAHPAIDDAVVLLRDMAPCDVSGRSDGSDKSDLAPSDRRLVAYLVPAVPPGLRQDLAARLPAFMVPSAFAACEALPINPNGKVDRAALARRPLTEQAAEVTEYVAPRTPLEERLAEIWSEVLDVRKPGLHDSFFELGGHSLLATRMVSRLREACGVEVPLARVFDRPTLQALAAEVEALRAAGAGADVPPIRAMRRGGERLPASFAQERLWFLDRLSGGDTAYNMPAAVHLEGKLDEDAFHAALTEIVRRHEVLRTRFEEDGGLVQVVTAAAEVALPRVDLGGLDRQRRDSQAHTLATRLSRHVFDLARGPLLCTTLLRLGPRDHLLVFVLHHIVFDGASTPVLLGELRELYTAFAAGRPSPLPELPIQYADYALWQRDALSGEVLERQMEYWRQRLAGVEVLELPTDRPRRALASWRGATMPLRSGLPLQLWTELARSHGVTPFMALLAVFAAQLGRLTGQTDVAVGSPIANRRHSETEGLLGFFVNTLVLRVDLAGRPGLAELLGRVRDTVLQADAHQDLPFEKLVQELAPERGSGTSPLFQALFAMQSAPLLAAPDLPGLSTEVVEIDNAEAKVELALVLSGTEEGLAGSFEYAVDLFDAVTVRRFSGSFKALLAGLAAHPDRAIDELDVLGAAQRQQVLVEWNDSRRALEGAQTIHGLFAARAEEVPEAVAVAFGDVQLTFGTLAGQVRRLARHLRQLGVGPEVRVGVSAERSPALVVGILGVFEAGGAYVPLDPGYPEKRLAVMAADAGVSVVVTDGTPFPELADAVVVVAVDEVEAPIGRRSLPYAETGPSGLAYVMYTSGSTGRPKGIQVSHGAIAHRLRWAQAAYPLTAEDRLLPTAASGFDISLWEIAAPLSAGARLVLVPGTFAATARLCRALTEHEITQVHVVPSLLEAWLDEPEARRARALRRVFCGGEALPGAVRERFLDLLDAELHHFYGPTEVSISVTAWDARDVRQRVTLGRPIANSATRLLDAHLRPVPLGAAGELFLSSRGLARGYHGLGGLTAEHFLPDPFSGSPGGRMYRTGDLARYRTDGQPEFLGRLDHQVKLRGVRIEPGEIEAALASCPGVAAAAVLLRDTAPGGPRLVGFWTPAAGAGEGPAPAELTLFLRDRLPAAMVPAAFARLAAWPLTPNGKIDRRALLRLPVELAGAGEAVAPRTPTEELLEGIWRSVLALDRVSVHASFFELGGHSLLAAQVASRVRDTFGVELSLRRFFERPTIADLARGIEAGQAGEASLEAPPIAPVARTGDTCPASFAQERLWFLEELQPGSTAYHLPAAVALGGELAEDALHAALTAIVGRHESLRTCLDSRRGETVQVVLPPREVPLPRVDLTGLDAAARRGAAHRLAEREGRRLFDLRHGPLLRATLLRLAPPEHVLVLAMHHVVSDGWSTGVFFRELHELYAAALAGRPPRLPALAVQYADYAVWQRDWLREGGEAYERQAAFWRRRLAGVPVLELPTDRPRQAFGRQPGDTVPVRLPSALATRLEELGRVHGTTLFMTLLASFAVLLGRWSGQRDVAVGSPVANRRRREIEDLIGFFVNTLTLRLDLGDAVSGEPTFQEMLERVRETVLEANAHQDIPFEKVVEELEPERQLEIPPLFQVMLAFAPSPEPPELPGLELETLALDSDAAKFDLTLNLSRSGDRLGGALEYRADLFDAATVRRMSRSLQRLLADAVGDAGRPISELRLLGAAERRQLLAEWNPPRSYTADAVIPALFETQVKGAADATAVVFPGSAWSYGELNRRANRLAHRLRDLGVVPEERVGLLLERGPDVAVALLAVLKAGGAYVALDAAAPGSRIAFLRRDTGMRVLVTHEAFLERLDGPESSVLLLDREAESLSRRPAETPESGLVGANLAYVIYTSGSTGRPKGVAISHRSLGPMMAWGRDTFGFGPRSRVLSTLSHTFDFGVFEILTTLLFGGTLHLMDAAERLDPRPWADYAERHDVNTVHATPSFIRSVIAGGAALGRLEVLHLGGEALSGEYLDSVFAALDPDCAVYNGYGPTEATINSTLFHVGTARRRRDAGHPRTPIGRPSADNAVYVTDGDGRPIPAGVAGELRVGGGGPGRGYLNRPALTAEKFQPDSFSARPGARLYRTGDRVRHLAGGDVDFLGRFDDQVKVRGFRIELGEIEAALAAQPEVSAAAVVDTPAPAGSEDRRLVAYLVAREAPAPAPDELRRRLGRELPPYMLPAAIVELEALPTTASGKVDRSSLRRRAPALPSGGPAHTAPRTPQEEVLAGIWSEVLGVDNPGVDDSFFDLGGHSLLATQVVSRIRRTFGIELALRRLFEAPTIAHLARHVAAARGADVPEAPPIEPVPRGGALALSFAQERLWFLDQLEPGSAFYNIPLTVRVRGPLRLDRLERCLAEVVRRQEVLRTTFADHQGRPFQVVAPPFRLSLPLVDLRALPPGRRQDAARRCSAVETSRPFDLATGPLLRAAAFVVADGETFLSFTVHHIVADGWSTGVLLSEVFAVYSALSRDTVPVLPELPVQYADYAVWQRGWLTGETLERQTAYWREQLAGITTLELPTDRPRPAMETFRGTCRPIRLDEHLLRDLKAASVRHGTTLFMALLAGMVAMLSRLSAQDDVTVGSPIANRHRYETENLIGFFANTLVLRTDLAGNPTWSVLLERVRDVTLGGYTYQDLPFEKLVEEVQPERDMSRNPLFQVMLVLQNQPLPRGGLEGLELEPVNLDMGIAKFDLTVFWQEAGGGIAGLLEYNTDLFDSTTALRMMALYEALLHDLAADPEARPAESAVLTRGQRHQLLHEWNATREVDLRQGCLHHWVEAQVERTPEALAVVDGERRLRYRELDERANQLAHALIGLGVAPETLVGICVERSVEMVLGFLAVLKAGGAGVALDPAYPRERLSTIIRDAGLHVLLADSHLLENLPEHGGTNLCLDQGWEPFEDLPAEDPAVRVDPDNPIYAIYTSGSTGRPKGILVTHRAFGNLMEWQRQRSDMAPRARTVQFATFGFCVSFQEMFSSWCAGGTLVMADEMVRRDIGSLVSFLEQWEIERLHVPFAALKQLAEVSAASDRLPARLKEVISAGEQLQVSPAVRRLFERLDGCALRNQYGASETHVVSDHCLTGPPRAWPAIPPVGRPVANVAIYLLDRHVRPVPLGVPGALYTSGLCDARGYLGDPMLTARKFLPDPYSPQPGRRLYSTGDLARRLATGEIEHLGRIDTQVKVRGYRVEVGEVETVLAAADAVRDVAVVPREGPGGATRLVAYVVLDGPAASSGGEALAELRAGVKQTLPEHMVPAVFVPLDVLPLNANGKLDREALPVPDALHADLAASFVAPRDEVEEVLAGIVAEVLEIDRVGVGNNFFELGGHSLLATQLVSKVSSTFRVQLPLKVLFEGPTVEELARAVTARESQAGQSAKIARVYLKIRRMSSTQVRDELGARQGEVEATATT